MPNNVWICLKCNSTNVADADSCQRCGSAATASNVETQGGPAEIKVARTLGSKALNKARREEFAALPLWKKPFALALRLLQLIGGVTAWLAIFDPSISGFFIGLALAAISEVLYQLLKGKPYAWDSS